MGDVCAGIVTYNPDITLLQKNIESVEGQVEQIIIVDNGSANAEELQKKLPTVIFVYNEKNEGIAAALNQLCQLAIGFGYQWLLTLDQDSISSDNLVSSLLSGVDNDVAIIAPNIIYRHNEEYADTQTKGMKVVDWAITSASLTSLKIWNELGGFDTALFIDGVDKDYCIRAGRAGYKVLKNYDVCLMHELGELQCRSVLGRTIYVTNHSPMRKYYMARNAVYLDKKLKLRDGKVYIFKLIVKTVLYENDKSKKLKAIVCGIKAGRKMETVIDTRDHSG